MRLLIITHMPRVMKMKPKNYLFPLIILGTLFLVASPAFAHRSGCHRWHSCPSDSGSYTCGDAGHPCQYPTYPASGGVIYPPSGYYKDCYNCPLKRVPNNASTSGIGYSCNSGYKKIGEVCEKIWAPANATVYGSSWYCNNGYKKVRGICEKVIAPLNATVYGSTWYCNYGYKKVGNSCQHR